MVELKFIGTPSEVKAEIREFIGTEFTEPKVEEITKKVEEIRTGETKLPVQEVLEVEQVVPEVTVLPTLPTVTIEYTVEDLQRIGASLLQKNPSNLALLSNTLKNYGVKAVGELPKEHYGAFVQDLKNLGADV